MSNWRLLHRRKKNEAFRNKEEERRKRLLLSQDDDNQQQQQQQQQQHSQEENYNYQQQQATTTTTTTTKLSSLASSFSKATRTAIGYEESSSVSTTPLLTTEVIKKKNATTNLSSTSSTTTSSSRWFPKKDNSKNKIHKNSTNGDEDENDDDDNSSRTSCSSTSSTSTLELFRRKFSKTKSNGSTDLPSTKTAASNTSAAAASADDSTSTSLPTINTTSTPATSSRTSISSATALTSSIARRWKLSFTEEVDEFCGLDSPSTPTTPKNSTQKSFASSFDGATKTPMTTKKTLTTTPAATATKTPARTITKVIPTTATQRTPMFIMSYSAMKTPIDSKWLDSPKRQQKQKHQAPPSQRKQRTVQIQGGPLEDDIAIADNASIVNVSPDGGGTGAGIGNGSQHKTNHHSDDSSCSSSDSSIDLVAAFRKSRQPTATTNNKTVSQKNGHNKASTTTNTKSQSSLHKRYNNNNNNDSLTRGDNIHSSLSSSSTHQTVDLTTNTTTASTIRLQNSSLTATTTSTSTTTATKTTSSRNVHSGKKKGVTFSQTNDYNDVDDSLEEFSSDEEHDEIVDDDNDDDIHATRVIKPIIKKTMLSSKTSFQTVSSNNAVKDTTDSISKLTKRKGSSHHQYSQSLDQSDHSYAKDDRDDKNDKFNDLTVTPLMEDEKEPQDRLQQGEQHNNEEEPQRQSLSSVDRSKIDEDLWMDSEPEDDVDEEDKEQALVKPRKGGWHDKSNKPKSKQQRGRRQSNSPSPSPTKNRKHKEKKEAMDFQDYNDVLTQQNGLDDVQSLLERDDHSLRKRLHPQISDPPFGPYELEPLVLTKENDDDMIAQSKNRANNNRQCRHHEVPAALSRYIAPFQKEGVQFLYNCISQNTGAILGDEMGAGKTMQVLSLLSALYEKTGTELDLATIQRRRMTVRERIESQKREQMTALLEGRRLATRGEIDWKKDLKLPHWYPVLILVPPTLIQNWKNEFEKFTHFAVATYIGDKRSQVLDCLRNGTAEILLSSQSLFKSKQDFQELNKVSWKLVIIDEFHLFKNKDGYLSSHLRMLKRDHRSLVIGMTGTLMQNDHNELWNLIDLVETGYLGTWDEFKSEYSIPIKIGRTKNADDAAIKRSARKVLDLNSKLGKIMIGRKKEEVLKDQLPEKTEQLILCELSPMQKRVYQHVLQLPDFELIQKAFAPCDCSVNAPYFARYQRLKSPAERVEYYRKHKKDIIKRKDCCYQLPLNPHRGKPGQPRIDPDAALWRMFDKHADGEACEFCPLCCTLPAFKKLDKVANHLALLQPRKSAAANDVGSPAYVSYMKELEFAKVAIPPDVLENLPGKSYTRKDGIMDQHFELSGKLKVIDSLLKRYQQEENNKTLIYSYSTQTLDLLQNYVRSKGLSFLRMDGTTNTSKRQEIADEFNKDPTIFLLLLSTKAMGLGLNLTSANKVIIFDVEWNPSWDEQAQDRAYRIGQKHDVQVVRLVSQGTVDELKYLRQLYKVQLKQETLQRQGSSGPKAARMFRGVQGDKSRKGELFGTENLLKFKDGCFLDDIWKKIRPASNSKKFGKLNVHETSTLAQELGKIGSQKCEEILHDSVCEIDAVMKKENSVPQTTGWVQKGKILQNKIPRSDSDDSAEVVEQAGEVIGIGGAQAVNHEDLFRSDRGRAAVQMGDDDFDVEMGGATQNAVAVYEQGGVHYGGRSKKGISDSNHILARINEEDDSISTDDNKQVLSDEDSHHMACDDNRQKRSSRNDSSVKVATTQIRPASNSIAFSSSDSIVADTTSEGQVRRSKKRASPGKQHPTRSSSGSRSPKPPKGRNFMLSVVGQAASDNVVTTFTAADISIPTYQIKKLKKRKKKNKD